MIFQSASRQREILWRINIAIYTCIPLAVYLSTKNAFLYYNIRQSHARYIAIRFAVSSIFTSRNAVIRFLLFCCCELYNLQGLFNSSLHPWTHPGSPPYPERIHSSFTWRILEECPKRFHLLCLTTSTVSLSKSMDFHFKKPRMGHPRMNHYQGWNFQPPS